jgi:hypothetical protein
MSRTQPLPAAPPASLNVSTGDPHRAQAAPFARSAGWLSLTAGALFLVAQAVMATFDQAMDLDTSGEPLFVAAKIVYLGGFVVLMFALIGLHGLQAHRAGRLGTVAFGTAIVGTMMLGGDLWFETFAVPWLAGGPGGQGLTSPPSVLMGLGAISSYLLFATGWTLFGIAALRARVFPAAISLAVVVGGLLGYQALLAPWGVALGLALTALGLWIATTDHRPRRLSRSW